MRQLLYTLLLLPAMAMAQSTNQNYVKGIVYKVPTLNGITATDGSGAVTDAKKAINVTYFDGLGRPMQQVAHKQSGTGTDIVTPIEYDDFGRQTHDYLPVPLSTSTMGFTENDDVIADPTGYYSGFGDDALYRFSEKRLEASPLGRVLEQGAPGEDWFVAYESDADHTIKFEYTTNIEFEVRKFNAIATWSDAKKLYDIAFENPNTSSFHAVNQLYKTITKDENWVAGFSNHTTEEFKNKQGQVVLKRTYNAGQMHDTYYVYDQFGNLTYVLPPLANGSKTDPVLEGLCYQYKYDSRNRLVEKKLPGKQWEFIVYDKLDRVVATGPANSPFSDITASGWLITKYDVFNRPILTAWKQASVTSSTRTTLQNTYNGATATTISEKRTVGPEASVGGVGFRYTNVAEPTTGYHILTLNYYDTYDFTTLTEWVPSILPTSVLGQSVYYNKTVKPKGLATGSWVRVLERSNDYRCERSYLLYDKKARLVMSHKVNHLGGYTTGFTQYDFEGKVLQTQTAHKRQSNFSEIVVNDYFSYSDQGRLMEHKHKVYTLPSGPTLPEELLAKNEYDDLGQLKSKKVGGPSATPNPLQKVDYTYNIRGWLKGINSTDGLVESGSPNDLFAFKIGYNDVEGISTPLFNGNIGETSWRSYSDGVLRKYSYEYDQLNRLTDAVYQKPESTTPEPDSYNEYLQYDKNGNITRLDRNGHQDTDTPYPIDALVYTYNANSNRLDYVVDQTNSFNGFKDGENPNSGEKDYYYDANGNMISDWNKGITQIVYNHLNLPENIVFQDNEDKKIEYLYNALGAKLRKTVTDKTVEPSVNEELHYLDGFQYSRDDLQFFPTAEGYVNVTDGKFKYVYNYTDHLGNIRMSYSKPNNDPVVVLEENHYYPFGMKHANYAGEKYEYVKNPDGEGFVVLEEVERSKYQYKYNGKEYQDELSLNWYDYGARNYDPELGRWMNIDPLTEIAPNKTPYHFVSNNPLNRVDPRGLTDYQVNGETRTINDGHDNVSMKVSERQFNRLQSKFDKGGSGYERMMNRMSVKNGFTTSSFYADNSSSSGFGVSVTQHKADGDSYGQWSIQNNNQTYGTVEHIARVTDSGLGAVTDQFGNVNLGSNGSMYFRQNSGAIFRGNQYVNVTSAASRYSGLAKGAKIGGIATGVVLGGYEIYQGIQQDGGTYGYNAQVQTAGAVGGVVGGLGGAKGGAALGAAIGVWFGGVGAVPGAIIGGLIGGGLGAWGGDYYGEQAAKAIIK